MIFLSLKGTPYEVGYQHGKRLRDLIYYNIRFYCTAYDKKQNDNYYLEKYSERLENNFPKIAEELKGISDGSGFSFKNILLLNLGPLSTTCSNLVFNSEDGIILGHVNDQRGMTQNIVFYISYKNDKEIIEISSAGNIVMGAGVSSDGLAISHSAAYSKGFTNTDAYLNFGLLRRIILCKASNIREAKSIIESNPVKSAADNIIIADSSGDSIVAEVLPDAVEFRYPENGKLYCTNRSLNSNIRKILDLDVFEKNDPGVNKLINREKYFESVFNDNEKFSVELMKKALTCRDDEIKVCSEISCWAAIMQPGKFQLLIADRFPEYRNFMIIDREYESKYLANY
ncbi:MAG: hypothetical protein K8S24_09595 [Candidatus Aegiribacteria sp.]|nr:hypothetical protein [Candidatus Aegiribacteria sp.]